MKAKYYRGQINRKQAEQMGEDIFFAGVYYRRLTKLKKEPTYYDDKITAEDKNAVLIHWKESDDKYRVIFGNLTGKKRYC